MFDKAKVWENKMNEPSRTDVDKCCKHCDACTEYLKQIAMTLTDITTLLKTQLRKEDELLHRQQLEKQQVI